MTKEELGQESAFPLSTGGYEPEFGISKRFYAACAAMQAIVSNHKLILNIEDWKNIAKHAYGIADELLKQENE